MIESSFLMFHYLYIIIWMNISYFTCFDSPSVFRHTRTPRQPSPGLSCSKSKVGEKPRPREACLL